MKYSVIDLFAGAGGLSLGFDQTDKFDIKVAFENNEKARKTYKRNHNNVEMQDDVCKADYQDILKRYEKIDVVIGGPPCQGFSNANRQKNHAISQNNMLVKQYIRAIIELQPKAFVMENVSMLKSNVHRFYLENEEENIIREYNISMTQDSIKLLDYEFRFDGAVDIIQNERLIQRYLWSDEEYLYLNVIYKKRKNKDKMVSNINKNRRKLENISQKFSKVEQNQEFLNILQMQVGNALNDFFNGIITTEQLIMKLEQPILVQRMLSKVKEIFDNNIKIDQFIDNNGISVNLRSYGVFDYVSKILGSSKHGYVIDSGVLNAADFGAPQKRMRFVVMGVKRELGEKISLPRGNVVSDHYTTVRDAIYDISFEKPVYEVTEDTGLILCNPLKSISQLGKQLRDSKRLYNHIITKNKQTALKRFAVLKQGNNFHDLDKSLKENTYTDASRTQNTIYLRLKYDEPSGTVVNVRKSMWIHPEFNRAISIREAARLQTFPDSFVFEGSKDSQYQQVGNAVPPILAKAIASSLAATLDKVK